MNIFTMFALFSLLTLILGAALMWLVVSLSQAVVQNTAEIEQIEREKKSVNPTVTAGYAIATARDDEKQLNEARKLAAKRAAVTPRGANMGIGRLGAANVEAREYNSVGATTNDPMSAVKIAKHHTWGGIEYKSPAPAAGTPVARGATKTVKRKLVPGTDFAWTDISGLSGVAKRTAIIANARAKATAYKAMKESGQDMVVEEAVAAPAASAAPTTAAVPAGLPPAPVLTEITDDMDPAEKRAAKIANSKAKSAYNKALKAMGIDPKTVGDGAAVPAPSAPATPVADAPVADASAAASGELPPPPDMIEITDDMSPDEKRSAKIANSKAKSAYKKELKAMGIDPKTVTI